MSDQISGRVGEISSLQHMIMQFIDQWAKQERTPVPLKEIVITLRTEGAKEFTILYAISGLVKKRYIRRALVVSKSASYVQLRRV